MKKYCALLTLATLVSGAVSAYLATISNVGDWLVLWGPGIAFGVIIGILFLITQKTHPVKILIWTGISSAAYYLAVRVAISLTDTTQNHISNLAFLMAGLLGGTLLSVSTKFLIGKLKINQIIITSALAGITGIIFGHLAFIEKFYGAYLAYIVWQMTVGICLGAFIAHNKKNV